jgi:hypothetical protein
MDHLVYVSSEAKELNRLLEGHKTIIIRAGDKKKPPFGEVKEGDRLFFMTTGRPGVVVASAKVKNVLFRENLNEEECTELLNRFLMDLMLSVEQLEECDGKPFISLMRIENVISIEKFQVKDDIVGKMKDWYITEDINTIRENIIVH